MAMRKIIVSEQGIVGELKLNQNYPNPFNPSTNLRFALPEVGLTTLKVIDVLSREVSVCVNEFKQAGVYEVAFDGSSLPSGVYFYRLHHNGRTLTRKMLLAR